MGNVIDDVVSFFNPKAGLRRVAARTALESIRSFEGASNGRRTKNWNTRSTSSNAENYNALSVLRNRSRDLVRNNSYAKNAINVLTYNTIGLGIRPSLKGTNKNNVKKLKKLWKDWAEKTKCDFDEEMNMYGLEALVFKTVAQSGECLILRRRMSSKEMRVLPIELQVLEPDFLDHHKNSLVSTGMGFVLQGKEYDYRGKLVAYWLFDTHPGEMFGGSATSKRVLAKDVIHVFDKDRPGQIRGIPFGASAFIKLKDLDEYEDAELIRQKIAACFAVFVHDAAGVVNDGNASEEELELSSRVEPGIIEHLPAGKTMTFTNPPVTQGYDPYTRTVLRAIAVGFGCTYEALSGDLSKVNFSSGRMGWLEFQRRVSHWQYNVMVSRFCDRVWDWFLEAAESIGVKTDDVDVSWTAPRREMIDPWKETRSLSELVRNGFTSWSEAARENGWNEEDLYEECKSDFEKQKKDKIIFTSNPANDIIAPAKPAKEKSGQA